jgi:hypothetical protein
MRPMVAKQYKRTRPDVTQQSRFGIMVTWGRSTEGGRKKGQSSTRYGFLDSKASRLQLCGTVSCRYGTLPIGLNLM